jgi:hypothetical protein
MKKIQLQKPQDQYTFLDLWKETARQLSSKEIEKRIIANEDFTFEIPKTEMTYPAQEFAEMFQEWKNHDLNVDIQACEFNAYYEMFKPYFEVYSPELYIYKFETPEGRYLCFLRKKENEALRLIGSAYQNTKNKKLSITNQEKICKIFTKENFNAFLEKYFKKTI